MKGIVFTLLNELVEDQFGMETWDSVLTANDLDGIYTSADTYPDEQLYGIVQQLSAITGMESPALIHAFGQHMLMRVLQQYPAFAPSGMKAKEFLKTVESIVHVEVLKLYPEATLPRFEYIDNHPDRLTMLYRSQRRLCVLAEGLIAGTSKHFGEPIHLAHPKCLLHGDDHCRLELTFGGTHE